MTIQSVRIPNELEERKRKEKITPSNMCYGHLSFCLQPRLGHALHLDPKDIMGELVVVSIDSLNRCFYLKYPIRIRWTPASFKMDSDNF
jgi:hypothetical protein